MARTFLLLCGRTGSRRTNARMLRLIRSHQNHQQTSAGLYIATKGGAMRKLDSVATMMRFGGVAAVVLVGTAVLSAGPVAAAAPSRQAPLSYTCTGGNFAAGVFTSIPSGHYSNITVAGACNVVPNAVITVAGSIDVNVGAVLDAQSAPSTIKVRQDVDAARGSLLGLGCLPNPVGKMTGHPCTVDPAESSEITVHGNIYGAKVNTVLLDGISVKGSVVLDGGGVQSGNPWPIKFDTIGGNLVVFNARPEWLGVINDSVHGDVILNKVTVAPGETMDVANNTIHLNLLCSKLLPAVSAGFVPGEINVVGGEAIGECPLAAS